MLLRCITNWNGDRSPADDSVEDCNQDTFDTTDIATPGKGERLGISPRDYPWDETELSKASPFTSPAYMKPATVLETPAKYQDHVGIEKAETPEETPDIGAVTLMGPPKEYYGESERERYAYMVHEAVILLHKHGFSTNITTLRHQALHTMKSAKKRGWTKQDKKYHRVPGILGFFLNDMSSDTKIAVFDPEDDELVASLGFMTYKQPWLKLCCRSYIPEHTQVIELLQLILSKRFIMIAIPHETKLEAFEPKRRVYGGTHSAQLEVNSVPSKDSDDSSSKFVLRRTTAMAGTHPQNEKLWTMFVLESDGEVVAKALWSYDCEGLDTSGPTMELFETFTYRSTTSAFVQELLGCMEEFMIQAFSPMVAFHLRFCRVDQHADAARWLSQRGYVASKHGNDYLHKAFVVF